MTDTPDPKPGSSPRWMRVVLFASLALNLMIVGMVAGALFRGGPGTHMRSDVAPPFFDLGNGPIGRALSRESRREIGRAMAGKTRDLQANRRETHAQYVALLQVLRQNPFEPSLADQIISRQQHNLLARQDIGKNLLVVHIAEMSQVERSEYTDRLERFLRRSAARGNP